jgi:hypothetical protein
MKMRKVELSLPNKRGGARATPPRSGSSDLRPQPVRARSDHVPPKHTLPYGILAELIAPRPQPARQEMQTVLEGEADRAMHLMGDGSANAGSLPRPRLPRRDRQDL